MFWGSCGTIFGELGGLVINKIEGFVSGVITGCATSNPLIGTSFGFSVGIAWLFIKEIVRCIIESQG